MKFLTKEWYHTMNDSGLGVCLEADARAAEFSEEMYQALRAEKLDKWLHDREEVCEILKEPFDPAGETQRFDEFCRGELEQFRARTPERVLSKVADLRVLALGYCTEAVWQDFEDFRRDCQERTEQTLDEAWKQFKAQGIDWTGEHSLHDSVVLSLKREGEDLLIEFERDEEADWPEIGAIRFREARILKHEKPLADSWWLYDEVWRTDGGIEVHALLWRDNDVFELTIGCRDTEILWTMEPQ